MSSGRLIVVFVGTGANDALRGLMADYGRAFEEFGRAVVQVDVAGQAAELKYAAELMRKGEAEFVMTWLGIGQDLTLRFDNGEPPRNAFEMYGVPLLKIQGDLPAYLPDRHRDVPRNCVNLYQAEEFIEFRTRWLPEARSPAFTLPPMPMVPLERSRIDMAARRAGRIVFLKNGNSPLELRNLWRTKLPARIGDHALALADAIAAVGVRAQRLDIGDFVADYLHSAGYRSEPPRNLVMFLSAQMDDYLRRIKSTMIAESVLDLPVLVQGNFWSHVDFAGRRARHVPGVHVDESQKALSHQLGVIDMSANTDTWPHDRVQRAAGAWSLVLTNRQGWMSAAMPEFEDLTFEFEPESIKARIADAIARPGEYVDRAVAFGERFRELFPREAFVRRALELVEAAALFCGESRPPLQDFYEWPHGGWH
jgi:hypothetical protein